MDLCCSIMASILRIISSSFCFCASLGLCSMDFIIDIVSLIISIISCAIWWRSVIMVPIILIASHEAFRLVPSSLREASLALGVPKWRTIVGVVLPVASRALITGAILAISRALGEAAPMLFTAFGNPFWNLNLGKPIATVPMLIYTYATGPYDDWHRKAWAASFVLMMVVLVTSLLTRAFLRGKTNE